MLAVPPYDLDFVWNCMPLLSQCGWNTLSASIYVWIINSHWLWCGCLGFMANVYVDFDSSFVSHSLFCCCSVLALFECLEQLWQQLWLQRTGWIWIEYKNLCGIRHLYFIPIFEVICVRYIVWWWLGWERFMMFDGRTMCDLEVGTLFDVIH